MRPYFRGVQVVVFILHTPGLGEGFLMGEEKSWTYYGGITENDNDIGGGVVDNDEGLADLKGIKMRTFPVFTPYTVY